MIQIVSILLFGANILFALLAACGFYQTVKMKYCLRHKVVSFSLAVLCAVNAFSAYNNDL